AGGDIRSLYQNGPNSKLSQEFFYYEYQMNAALHHFPKPYIALLNGITMGGGAGVSLHGSHPVGTERLMFAMPECSIGFFPDVGAGYFLSRLKNHIGYYLGLTGSRFNAADAKNSGLIKHVINSQLTNDLI